MARWNHVFMKYLLSVIFRTLVNTLIISAVTLLLLEVILRIIKPFNDTNPVLIEAHETLPYIMTPKSNARTIYGITISINDRGLRDLVPSESNVKIEKTYLSLGDSTAYGYGVQADETYAERLEQALNQLHPENISVINAGHSGYNLKDTANLLEILDKELNYNTIIIGIMGNDFTQHSLEYKFKDGVGITPGSFLDQSNMSPKLVKYLRNSALYLTIGNAIKGARYQLLNTQQAAPIDLEPIVEAVSSSLEKIKLLANKNKVPLYLVYLPTKTELLKRQEHYPVFNKLLRSFSMKNEGIYFLDLTKKETIIEQFEDIYFKTDWVHPNSFGHSAYCAEILEFMFKVNKVETRHFNC